MRRKSSAAVVRRPVFVNSSFRRNRFYHGEATSYSSSSSSSSKSSTIDAKTKTLLSGLEFNLGPKESHKGTLIWLHGLGDSSHGFADLFEQITPMMNGWRVILLDAEHRPITANFGMVMPGWYDIASFDRFEGPNYSPHDGVEESYLQIQPIIEREVKQLNHRAENLYLGGFSQGGAMSIYNGIRYLNENPTVQLGGILSASGYVLENIYTSILNDNNNKNNYNNVSDHIKDVNFRVYHGDQDPTVPFTWAKQSYDRLAERLGLRNFQFQKLPRLGHTMSEDEITQIIKWLHNPQKVK